MKQLAQIGTLVLDHDDVMGVLMDEIDALGIDCHSGTMDDLVYIWEESSTNLSMVNAEARIASYLIAAGVEDHKVISMIESLHPSS